MENFNDNYNITTSKEQYAILTNKGPHAQNFLYDILYFHQVCNHFLWVWNWVSHVKGKPGSLIVFEKRVLKNLGGPKCDEDGENYIMTPFVTLLHSI